MNPFDLPVYKQRNKILEKLSQHQVIVVESPTGSGKTTQIPQILFESGYTDSGMIGITQPRRIAAVSVSEFIAQQMDKTIPDTVGYKMRFEDKTDLSTHIKIMTDGILLQEIKADYNLSRYSVIIVDEAHERSLNIDFILGLLKRILNERPNFKVIISSATINAEIFSEYFDECPVVNIDTISYPVNVNYYPLKKEGDYDMLLDTIIEIICALDKNKDTGAILIFLSGVKAIKECITRIKNLNISKHLEVIPLYSRLSSAEQEKIFFDYTGKKKVIVATNIAETSVTIDGITTIIDCGLAKMNFYNQKTFTSSLIEIPISRASCNQRKGRAGRTSPGVCYRLYSYDNYKYRPLFTQEEIFRTDLSEVVLRMAEIGIKDFTEFDFISPPGKTGIISAVETLKFIEAIDSNKDLTKIGRMMLNFPMLPKHSRIIVEAVMQYPDVIEEVIIASSFLTTNSPFLLPQGEELEARRAHHTFRDSYGDFMSYLKIFRSFMKSRDKKYFCKIHYLDFETMNEILNIKLQLEEIISEMGIPIQSGGSIKNYLSAIAKGLIQFLCTRTGKGIYRSLTAEKIQIHPGSVMFRENPPYIVAGEIMKTTRMYARSVSPLKLEWIKRISPLLYKNMIEGISKQGSKTTDEAFKTKNRDFTKQIKIGTGIFRIIKENRRKVVLLPWEHLKAALKGLDPAFLPNYKNLKGKILFYNYELLAGMNLKSLIILAYKIKLDNGILKSWQRKSYTYPESLHELSRQIEKLLFICGPKKKSKSLGFLSLYTDGKGNYRFKCIKGFHTALTESLSSLENLVDETDETIEKQNKQYISMINSAFRRLKALLEK